MIKILLILGVIACSVLIGVSIKNYFLSRCKFFESFYSFLKIAQSELAFLKTDKKTLLLKNCKGNKVLEDFVNDYFEKGQGGCNFLKKEEEEKVNSFLDSIGKKDIEGELHNFNFYENYINLYMTESKEKYEKYGVFAVKFSIIIGALVAIILI